jgi:tripartite-type tricarboxylate transporter receptor subunit TctC
MKKMLAAMTGGIVGLWCLGAAAQTFPDRPIQIIVPWAAGGGTDTVVRTFAAGLEKEAGVPINVVNRPGGNGVAGHTAIVNATPDGYTLGAASPEIAFYKTLGTADLTPQSLILMSRLATIPAGITVKADSPYKTLDDLLKAIRENPKGFTSSSGTGVGGSWHIAIGGLLKAAGVEVDKVRWVPSNGGAPALQEVMAGGITMFSGSPIEAKGMLDGGRVRTIALMTETQSPAFKGVPTAKEQGVNWVYENWFALVAPKGIPEDRRAKLYELAKKANAREDVQSMLKERGIQPVWDEPGEFDKYVANFVAKGDAVLKDLGLAQK